MSSPLLHRWLGDSFVDLAPLMCLLVGSKIFTLPSRVMQSVNAGLTKVRLPSMVAIAGGVVNVLLSVVLVRFTNLGLYGVALSTVFCLVAKNFVFAPVYTAAILERAKTTFLKELLPGVAMAVCVSFFAWALTQFYFLATIPRLLVVSGVISLSYFAVCYTFVLNREDRTFMSSLIRRRTD